MAPTTPSNKRSLVFTIAVSAFFFIAFFLLLALLLTTDRAPSGDSGAVVGLSAFNSAVFSFFGKSDTWYSVSNVLGLFELASMAFFGLLFLYQWKKRKKLSLVDRDLFALFALYLAVALIYVFFELFVINCRPVLIDGKSEPSFPSSHAMISVFSMGAAALQAKSRLKGPLAVAVISLCVVTGALVVFGRLCSGVHWGTDIIASVLLGGALLPLYNIAASALKRKQEA